jgi:hypothetical protein
MGSVNAPFGLRAVYHPSGVIRPEASTIASGYGTSIYTGAPVAIAADGTITAAAAGGRACGIFMGCEYTDATGKRNVSPYWPASTVATDIVAYFTRDPNIIYEVQADATLTQANVGGQYDWTANGSANGNTVTGQSTVALGVSTVAANAGLQLLAPSLYPDNLITDTYPIVQVRISEHQLRADVAQF